MRKRRFSESLPYTDLTISIANSRSLDCLISRKFERRDFKPPYIYQHFQIMKLLEHFDEKITDKYNDHFLRMTSGNSVNIQF